MACTPGLAIPLFRGNYHDSGPPVAGDRLRPPTERARSMSSLRRALASATVHVAPSAPLPVRGFILVMVVISVAWRQASPPPQQTTDRDGQPATNLGASHDLWGPVSSRMALRPRRPSCPPRPVPLECTQPNVCNAAGVTDFVPGASRRSRVKVIVTGGAGFIGSAVVRFLTRQEGAKVVNVDKLTYAGNLESLAPLADSAKHVFKKIDICDRDAIQSVFHDERPHAVIHLAAETHVDRSIDGPESFLHTNLIGTGRSAASGARLLAGSRPPTSATSFASCTSPRTRSTATSATAAGSPWKPPPTRRARPTRRPKPARITWCAPGAEPTAYPSWSRTARTTTVPTSSPRS